MKTTKRNNKKSKMNPKAFKKAFSFRQSHQQSGHPQHTIGRTSPSASDIQNRNRYTKSNSSSSAGGYGTPQIDDDDASSCSSTFDVDGVLVFPTAQRLTTTSCPPVAMLDSIPGLKQGSTKQQKGDGFLFRRSGSAKGASSLSSSAPPALSAPYESKQALKNLPPTLKHCRKSSSKKQSMKNSAWERRQPVSTSRRANTSFSRSMGSGIAEGREVFFTENRDPVQMVAVGQTGSSDYYLPPEVSPANKFVPIGYEEDDDDDFSFNSQDYDICKQSMSEDGEEVDHPATLAATVVASTTSLGIKIATSFTNYASVEVDDTAPVENDKYTPHVPVEQQQGKSSSKHHYNNGVFDLPPSPVATDDLSQDSQGFFQGMYNTEFDASSCCERSYFENDKYDCVGLGNYKEDWVGKLSSYFVSNCGAFGS